MVNLLPWQAGLNNKIYVQMSLGKQTAQMAFGDGNGLPKTVLPALDVFDSMSLLLLSLASSIYVRSSR